MRILDSAARDEFMEICRLAAGDSAGALAKVDELLAIEPLYAEPWLIKGHLHWKLGDAQAAYVAFEQFLVKRPRSSDGSLGLFHTLMELGREQEALGEMRRYLELVGTESNSQAALDYRQIIASWHASLDT